MKFLIVFLLVFFGYNYQDEIGDYVSSVDFGDISFGDLGSQSITYGEVETLSRDLKVQFCPDLECLGVLSRELERADYSIKCAFYEFDNEPLAEVLISEFESGVDIEIIVDNKYLDEKPLESLEREGIPIYSDEDRGTRYDNYMHDKFCVIDNFTLITGSANPTENGMNYNDNNIIVVDSVSLSKNYLNEFEQMKSGKFGTNKKSVLEFNKVILRLGNGDGRLGTRDEYVVSSFFCPQDDCVDEVLNVLNSAQEEILFASFVLTEDSIESLLELKAKSGVNVSGVIENRMWNIQGSIADNLSVVFSLKKDSNPKTMHHKFFVVDEKIVVTGSMNPSKSGGFYNDENVLVIENRDVALAFKSEFERVFGMAE